jgi:hypothetical protein
MREEKIEQFKKESPTLDKLKELKAKQETANKEDPTYPMPLHPIDLDNLDPAVLKLYELYEGGRKNDLEVAQTSIEAIREKMEKAGNKEKRENDEKFINWIDDEINRKLSESTLAEGRQQQ